MNQAQQQQEYQEEGIEEEQPIETVATSAVSPEPPMGDEEDNHAHDHALHERHGHHAEGELTLYEEEEDAPPGSAFDKGAYESITSPFQESSSVHHHLDPLQPPQLDLSPPSPSSSSNHPLTPHPAPPLSPLTD